MGDTPESNPHEPISGPDNLLHRHDDYHSLLGLLSAPRRNNVHIYGPRGTGKTLVLQHVLEDLSDDILGCYIPCIRYDSQYKVLQELYRCLSGDAFSSGHHTAELQDRVAELLDGTEAVLCLDEIDFLLHNDGNSLLYFLSRIEEAENLSIVSISSNHPTLDAVIDGRVHNSLHPRTVRFDSYTSDQARDILLRRVQRLQPRVEIEDEAIQVMVDATTNIQLGIHWLARAARGVENTITGQDIDSVRRDAVQLYWDVLLQDFSPHHHLLVEAISQLRDEIDSGVTSGPIYERYQDLCSMTDTDAVSTRQCGDYLTHLELLGIVRAERYYGGENGKTRRIKLNHPI
jgi:Cdc6-like AAA superfamily ATPase